MSPLSRLLAPLRQAAAAFFRHDLAVRRRGDQVQVVLAPREPAGGKRHGSKARNVDREELAELTQIRVELAALLNEQPETRQTMRHLVFVEKALAKKGLRALHKVPLDVLQRAHEQLEGLVVNWSPQGLANLRSKMAVAIIDREHMPPDDEPDTHRTAALAHPAVARPAAAPPQALPPPSADDDAALAAAYAALGTLAPSPSDPQPAPGPRVAMPLPLPLGADEPDIDRPEVDVRRIHV